MKNIFLIIILALAGWPLEAQKHDYIWVGGEQNYLADTTRGGMIIDFKQSPPKMRRRHRDLELFLSSSVISDTAGNIQVYTNGCDIANGGTDEILPNGNDINPGYVNEFQCHNPNGVGSYTAGIQSSLFLPLPDTTGIYYLFHKRVQIIFDPFEVRTDMLFYSVVDMHLNNGDGDVTQKNIPLMEDTLTLGMMTAVKHANGKDWWIITASRKENAIYAFLFTKNGIQDTVFQHIGFDYLPVEEGSGQITFNSLGTQMVICNPYYGINLFDFDRSTGLLSNFRQYLVEFPTVFPDVMGCAFSPNGRFLYVTTVKEIFQYDLESADIPGTRVLLDTWDGFSDPLPATFLTCQLAPDCKIYVQTNQQARWLHVIHYPDALGLACSFEQRGLKLPTPNRLSIPFFPNFRLGPSNNPGVPCTSVVQTTAPPTPLPMVSVFPNPVTDILHIVPNRKYNGQGRLVLFNATGGVAWEAVFNPASESSTVLTRDLPSGMYFYQVWCEGIMVRADKLMVL